MVENEIITKKAIGKEYNNCYNIKAVYNFGADLFFDNQPS